MRNRPYICAKMPKSALFSIPSRNQSFLENLLEFRPFVENLLGFRPFLENRLGFHPFSKPFPISTLSIRHVST